MYGEMPSAVDHINHIRTDNRLLNLREVSGAKENSRNTTLPKNNTSGRIGVCWNAHAGKWHSRIKVNQQTISLGYFSSIEEASEARTKAERRFGFHVNHGTSLPIKT
jgi:hypothetical protein